MEKHFLNYLINNSDNYSSERIRLLKYELGGKVSHYGDHFTRSKKKHNWLKFDNVLKDLVEFCFIQIFKKRLKITYKKKILSTAVSNWDRNIRQLHFCVENPPWAVRRDLQVGFSLKLYLLTQKIKRHLRYSNFNYLISSGFFKIIDTYYIHLKNYCETSSYDALIICQYNGLFEKMATKIFRELNKPVFFWHHGGLPANYNKKHQERADYFILMGQRQVDDYVKMGYDSSKFRVSGHPVYNKTPDYLSFELNRVLVITKPVSGYSALETISPEHRENSLTYLYSVQKILERQGVKHAIFRPHPSENHEWYNKFIDTNFYTEDTLDLEKSIKHATLVVGPISTIIIDTLYHGVNYVVYEPIINNMTIQGHLITPPLDGSDPKFPVAHSEKDLESILIEKKKISIDYYGKLVKTPREIEFLKDLI